MPYNTRHPQHIKAAEEAKNRSDRWCQFCGLKHAAHAHHWRGYNAGPYKPEEETTADELTGLCLECHGLATIIRKAKKFRIEIQTETDKEKRLDAREKELDTREREIVFKTENLEELEEELEAKEKVIEEAETYLETQIEIH